MSDSFDKERFRNDVMGILETEIPRCMDQFPKGRKFNEPDYTAGLALGLPKLLGSKEKTYPGLRFGGCFIHQSPYVTFDKGGETCEFGDLLLLCHERFRCEERYNAVVLQLKRVGRPLDMKQFALYTEWPKFAMGRTWNPEKAYDLNPKLPMPGAMYGIIHTDSARLRFSVVSAKKCESKDLLDVSNVVDLARYIVNFILGEAGRNVAVPGARDDDEWSRLIWDVVEKLDGAKFKDKNISEDNTLDTKERFVRRSGAFFDCLLKHDFKDEISGYKVYDDIIENEFVTESTSWVRGVLYIEFDRHMCSTITWQEEGVEK